MDDCKLFLAGIIDSYLHKDIHVVFLIIQGTFLHQNILVDVELHLG
jgi:hypothetical protein